MSSTSIHQSLPYPAPTDGMQRMTLITLRRMGAHGIRDAQAALLFINAFGKDFRKPLVLLRAFMVELARVSARRITLAPCCALRMTADEARLIGILATAAAAQCTAARHLSELAGTGAIGAPLSTAAAFGDAVADLGRPLVI